MPFLSLLPLKSYRVDQDVIISVWETAIAIRIAGQTLIDLGWDRSTRVDILMGNGPDLGRCRLIRNSAGWSLSRAKAKAEFLRLELRKDSPAGRSFPQLPSSLPATGIGCKLLPEKIGFEFHLPWIMNFGSENVKSISGGGRMS